mgnify:CR=1 FL=1
MADDSAEIVKEMTESTASVSAGTLGSGAAFYQNMGFSNAVAHQQAMNQLTTAIVGKVAESIISTSAAEGVVDTAVGGQLLKGLKITPPVE